MSGGLFRFLQIDIHILDELINKFSEFCPLFILDRIPDESIPSHMLEYQTRTGRKTICGTKKLLCATKILLYSPMLKWYISHGLKVTAIHKYLKYESSQPFSWFLEKVSKARHDEVPVSSRTTVLLG